MVLASLLLFSAASIAVVDGDGFRGVTLDGEALKVRIWGIDAPELHRAAGTRAKARLVEIIDGQPLACELRGPDSHDRKVAQCWTAQGRDLACAMVASHLAFDWPKFSGGLYAACEQGEPG